MKAKKGDKIKLEYTGKIDNGATFERSEKDKPLEFTVGTGQVIPGIDRAVEGMDRGEGKTVTIRADEAYGQRDSTLITRVDKSVLPAGFVPEKGMMVSLHLQTGEVIPATIVDVLDKEVVIDLNHPLAGKDLTFELKIVDIVPEQVPVM